MSLPGHIVLKGTVEKLAIKIYYSNGLVNKVHQIIIIYAASDKNIELHLSKGNINILFKSQLTRFVIQSATFTHMAHIICVISDGMSSSPKCIWLTIQIRKKLTYSNSSFLSLSINVGLY